MIGVGMVPIMLPDPANHMPAWLDRRFDAILFDPFCSKIDPIAGTVLARGIARQRPLLVLTPNDCAAQRTNALMSGADDAIFGQGEAREMVARLAALLRCRQLSDSSGRLVCDELEIDLIGRHVARAGRAIAMPLREFDLLSHLAQFPDRVVSRPELLRTVWRINFDPGTNRIDVHMSRLRQRVDHGHPHAMLRTVKGVGYALVSRSGTRQGAPRAAW